MEGIPDNLPITLVVSDGVTLKNPEDVLKFADIFAAMLDKHDIPYEEEWEFDGKIGL